MSISENNKENSKNFEGSTKIQKIDTKKYESNTKKGTSNTKKHESSTKKPISDPKKPTDRISAKEKLEKDYRMFVFRCLQNLYQQTRKADAYLKNNLFVKKQFWQEQKTPQSEADFRKAEQGYVNHLWMMQQLEGLTLQDVMQEKGLLKTFAQRHKEDIYTTLQKNITDKEKMDYISVLIADFYHKASEQPQE